MASLRKPRKTSSANSTSSTGRVHVEQTSIVQNAWERGGQKLEIHGWIYRLSEGYIYDLNFQPSPTHI